MSDDILLGEAEQTALKWAMGMPWFDRLADPATREAALSDLCVRLEAIGHDDEIEELSQRVHALRKYADGVEAERDRLRSALLDILVVENLDSAHLLADGALNAVTSELDQIIEYARVGDERESITCPRCNRTSHHPADVAHGYCGNCHDFTGTPAGGASGMTGIGDPERLIDPPSSTDKTPNLNSVEQGSSPCGGAISTACPNCGAVEPREPYDIGSGPELSCAQCEWCWGAEGQELNPIGFEEAERAALQAMQLRTQTFQDDESPE